MHGALGFDIHQAMRFEVHQVRPRLCRWMASFRGADRPGGLSYTQIMLRRFCILSICIPALLPAALLRIEVSERADVSDGKVFAAAGPYERIVGKAYFAVDPNLPANKIITDIAKAPRDQDGLVEFSADFECLKPRDPHYGNHAVLFEVSNRGGKAILGMFGDDFLMEQGYTLVWLGWEFDVPPGPSALRLYAPVAQGITGLVRSEITPDHKETRWSLGDRSALAYPVLHPDDPALTLTVREHGDSPRRALPRDAWHIEGGTHIVMPAGFEPGKIYELVYTSKDPPIVGLGPAAVRDLISFLKYGIEADTILGDHHDFIKRAYGFGVSQSGRFLRTFVYYGFNSDEQGRRVFDGLMVHVAGAGRGSFNHRFAQPSRDGHPFLNTFYPTDIFPFTDLAETDAETGITDGLLTHATPPAAVPKIFYTNSSYEYYGRSASLIHTTLDGAKDAPLRADHAYLFSVRMPAWAESVSAAALGRAKPVESQQLQMDAARAAGGARPVGRGRAGAAAVALSEDRGRQPDDATRGGVSRSCPACSFPRASSRPGTWITAKNSAARGL